MGLRKKAAVGLGLVAVAAVGFCVYVQAGTDTEAPVISYGEELTRVTHSTTKEMLLADVKAVDNKDGIISSQVIVGEQTINGDSVEIVYIVADHAGNVASKTRVVPYEGGAAIPEEQDSTQEDGSEEETIVETKEQAEEDTEEESTETVPEETEIPQAPVITLNQSSVTLPAGSRFEYSTYIASVSDDVDTREELFQNLVITGHYDVNTPGSYPLEFWVTDKDGHQSERQSFTLIIE